MSNVIQIMRFGQEYQIWVKDERGAMIVSLPYQDEKQVQSLCDEYDAYVETDEHPWFAIDTENCSWEYQDYPDDDETYISGNLVIEDKTVVDYDGCYDLPQEIVDALIRLGYKVDL